MNPARAFLILTLALSSTTASPVRRTLNFNMFVLKPRPDAPDRLLISTNGVSRFGPLLEYLVQRVQGLLSVRVHPDEANTPVPVSVNGVPIADAAENEVDSLQEIRMPGVVVRPSRNRPGTYEVEMAVVVDDEKAAQEKKRSGQAAWNGSCEAACSGGKYCRSWLMWLEWYDFKGSENSIQ